jgi:chlorite dismutase
MAEQQDLSGTRIEREEPAEPQAPYTLEGAFVLHQMHSLERERLRALAPGQHAALAAEARQALAGMETRGGGCSALFFELGHKGDLIWVHLRPSVEELAQAQLELAGLRLAGFLSPRGSYLSVVEIGLYELTPVIDAKLREQGIKPGSAPWAQALEQELSRVKEKFARRLYPLIPERRCLCFYPMNKKRAPGANWYRLGFDERRRLMHDHGLIGRRYGDRVVQIISGSTGLDDWEWGVDLFADDPLVFKRMIYEMRFDESSALYAEFGPFHVGLRLGPEQLEKLLLGGAPF